MTAGIHHTHGEMDDVPLSDDPSQFTHDTGTFKDLNQFSGQSGVGDLSGGSGLTKEQYAMFQAAKARRAEQKTNELIDEAIQSDPKSIGKLSVAEELKVESRITELLLQKCASKAVGDMQIACAALKKGLAWGTSTAKALQINLDLQAGTLSGIIDMSSVFGKWAKMVNFEFSRTSLTLTMPKGAKVTLGGCISKMTGGEGVTGDGPIDGAIIKSLRLNELGFTLKTVVISFSPFAVKLDATLDIMGLKVPFSLVAGKFRGFAVAMMINIDKKHAVDFIGKAFSSKMRDSMSWFSIKALSFGVSTKKINFADYPELSIMSPEFGEELKKGLQLGIKINFNKNSNNKFGAALARMLGPNAEFVVKVWVNAQELGLSLGLPDFKMDKQGKYMLTENSMYMTWKFPAELRLGLTTTLRVQMSGKNGDKTLQFKASLFLTPGPPPALGMSMVMQGMWERAFGIDALSIGRLFGEIVVTPVAPFISSIELGGEAHFGEAKLAIGIRADIMKPMNSWFYADARKLTIGTIFNAISGKQINLPRFLADTGFPETAELSFAFKDSVAVNGREIPEGFKAKGRFNFLGYNIFVDTQISKKRFKFYGVFDPLNFAGGLVVMARSSQDSSKGPLVNIDIQFNKLSALIVEVRGYVKLFLFEAEVQVLITSKKLSIDITAPLYKIFRARVQMSANYDSLKNAAFSYQVDLEITYFLKSFSEAFSRVAEMVNRAFKIANQALEDAKGALERAKCDIPRQCGFCSLELSSLSLLEVNSTRQSNADRGMVMTALERAQIHEHVLDRMEHMTADQMEQHGMLNSNEEVWGKHEQDRSVAEAQAWHDVIAEERMRQFRRMHANGEDVPEAVLLQIQEDTESEAEAHMRASAAVDRLRADEQSLRSGRDSRHRTDAEVEAILEGDASKFLEEESADSREQRSLMEMEAMLEDEFGIDLEFHEAEDIVHEIRLRRVQTGLSQQFDDESYAELERRFMERRNERKQDLLARVQRRRLRHYHRSKHDAHTTLADLTHDSLQQLSIKQLAHMKRQASKRKVERHAKLQDEESSEAQQLAAHKQAHSAKLHGFISHHKYDHAVDDLDGHDQVEDQAHQSLSELQSTMFHQHDHAQRVHDMVHMLHSHRVEEEAQFARRERLYQSYKHLYKSGAFSSEVWQLQQVLKQLDRDQEELDEAEHRGADVELMDELLDKIEEAEKSGSEVADEHGYSDSLVEAIRRFPQPSHHDYVAHSRHQDVLPGQWQAMLAPHTQLDFSRKAREYLAARTDIELRRRLAQKRIKELEREPVLVEMSADMMHWMNMLDARDKEIEDARAKKKEEEERREAEWAEGLRQAGLEGELMEVESEHEELMEAKVHSRVRSTGPFGERSPAECWADRDCRAQLERYNVQVRAEFTRLWNSNQALQDQNAMRLYELKVEMCGWKKTETDAGTTYSPPTPPAAPVQGQTESKADFQNRLSAYSDLVDKLNHCAVDYDPCPSNIPCSKSIISKQFELGRFYERMKNTVVPVLDPTYSSWGMAMLAQETGCWNLQNPLMTTMCIEGVQQDLSARRPSKPVERPSYPRPRLSFFARIGCEIKRAGCIIGCTIRNVALQIAQGILTACQGIISAIRWVVNKVTAVLTDLAKNIEISVMFGASLSTTQLSFKVGFKLKFYPINFDFKMELKLSLLGMGDLFKAMLNQVWKWFLSKIGIGSMKSTAKKNPAINSEFGI